MSTISIKLKGQYIGVSNPAEKVSELIKHYLSVYHKDKQEVEAMVIAPTGSNIPGYKILGL